MKKLVFIVLAVLLIGCEDQMEWNNDFVFVDLDNQEEIYVNYDSKDLEAALPSTNNSSSAYLISLTRTADGLEVIFYREAGYDIVYFSGYEGDLDEEQPWIKTDKPNKRKLFVPNDKLTEPTENGKYYFMISNLR